MSKLFLFVAFCMKNASPEPSDIFERADVIDDLVCSKPYPSENLIHLLRNCDPVAKIVGPEVSEECHNQYFEGKNLNTATEQHEHICNLSDEEHVIFEALIFDCMRDAGLEQNLTEIVKLAADFKKDPDRTLDKIAEADISCTEKVLKIG